MRRVLQQVVLLQAQQVPQVVALRRVLGEGLPLRLAPLQVLQQVVPLGLQELVLLQ